MVTVAESANAVTQGNSDYDGLRLVSLNQNLDFTQYTRKVLPVDGYVFWLRTQTKVIKGSLHARLDKRQLEDEYPVVNTMLLTTMIEVQEFNDVDPDIIWIGEIEGKRYSFTRQDVFQAAGTFHYSGEAVYPALETQFVNTGEDLPAEPIVSNSLPFWLALKTYNPVWLLPANPAITLYPSFLVPANLQPPYGTVHIDPAQTVAIQPVPEILATSIKPLPPRGADHYQLASDQVRITLYGTQNQQSLDFLDLVNQYSYYEDAIGIMGTPAVMRDEKRVYPEAGIIAMKKTVVFTVSYYQKRANDVARQLIYDALPVTYLPNPLYP